MKLLPLFLVVLVGCKGKDDSSPADSEAFYNCQTGDNPTLTIGSSLSGGEFTPLENGAIAGLTTAPQGGFGVSISALTTGLLADSPADVLLETEIQGETVGSFLNEGVQLYCQADGSGMLWGVVVGFDSSIYSTNDDLLALDGQEVDLVVTATDLEGRTAQGRVSVVMNIGN